MSQNCVNLCEGECHRAVFCNMCEGECHRAVFCNLCEGVTELCSVICVKLSVTELCSSVFVKVSSVQRCVLFKKFCNCSVNTEFVLYMKISSAVSCVLCEGDQHRELCFM